MYLPPRIYGQFMCTRCRREKEFLDWDVEPHGEPVIDNACYCGGEFDVIARCDECEGSFPESALTNFGNVTLCEKCEKIFALSEAG